MSVLLYDSWKRSEFDNLERDNCSVHENCLVIHTEKPIEIAPYEVDLTSNQLYIGTGLFVLLALVALYKTIRG